MNKESKGATSTIFLILGVILLVAAVIVFVVISVNSKKNTGKNDDAAKISESVEPIYETQLGDVKFIFESAIDIGSVLVSKDAWYQPNLVTTERFIKVTIGAQNKGKLNVKKDSWSIGNIVDSEGRNFVSIGQDNQNSYFRDLSDMCGALLKPEFTPTPCVKYYEVSKKSNALKVEVYLGGSNTLGKKQQALIDLIVN